MATVTGFTAERMLEIENDTVVDGNVVTDNLILVTRGGTQINAGNVRGPQGTPGSTGPPGPVPSVNDQTGAVYAPRSFPNKATLDSSWASAPFGAVAIINGELITKTVAGWHPPWNVSWGELHRITLSGNPSAGGTVVGSFSTSAITLAKFKNRRYKLEARLGVYQASVAAVPVSRIRRDGTVIAADSTGSSGVAGSDRVSLQPVGYHIGDGIAHTFDVIVVGPTGYLDEGVRTSSFTIVDMGPEPGTLPAS